MRRESLDFSGGEGFEKAQVLKLWVVSLSPTFAGRDLT